MRKLTILIMMMTMIVITLNTLVYSIPECQRQTTVTEIPCNIISSYQTNCAANLTIYNINGTAIKNISWGNYGILCNATFNITSAGTYTYNSTIETGIITIVGDDNMILVFIIIPIAMMFMFIYWGNSLPDDQEPLKWFMRLLALLMVFLMYGAATIAISMYPTYNPFLSIFDIQLFGAIFWTIMAVFFVWFIYKIFISFKQKRKDDLLYGGFR